FLVRGTSRALSLFLRLAEISPLEILTPQARITARMLTSKASLRPFTSILPEAAARASQTAIYLQPASYAQVWASGARSHSGCCESVLCQRCGGGRRERRTRGAAACSGDLVTPNAHTIVRILSPGTAAVDREEVEADQDKSESG